MEDRDAFGRDKYPPYPQMNGILKVSSSRGFIALVTCGYLLFGLCWIFFSDRLLLAFTSIPVVVRMSTVKGIVFVLLSSLYFLLALLHCPDSQGFGVYDGHPASRIPVLPERQPWWMGYVFAATVTIAMLYLRMQLAVSFGRRPLLILFVPPIILSSVLGGLGPGLFATAIASLGIDYWGIPPIDSLQIRQSHDVFQWFMLIVSGVLSSYLSHLLLRARRQAEARRASQEKAQDELRLSEERFQLAMRGSNDGLWDWNLLTDDVYLSPRWKSMLGFPEDQLADRMESWKHLVHPDDLQRTLSQVNDLVAGRSDRFEIEYRMRHRQGRYLDILSRAFAVTDDSGTTVRLVGTHVDMTRRRQDERRLQEREALLDKTSRMAKVGGWGFDVETGTGAWSDEVARIHDLAPGGRIRVEEGLGFFHGEHRLAIQKAVKEAIEEARPYDLELEIVSAKGVRKWVRTVGQPVLQDGRVVGVEGIFQDISERKQAEDEIQALNVELERRVEQRTAELVAANAELESFSYAVSHDLRAPLRAMSGFSQALIEDYGETMAGEARIYLDQIIIGSHRMGELIDGLLTLSRSTRSQVQPVAIDLSLMARRLLGELAGEEPGREVQWQVEPGLSCRGDATMMEVVLRNLLANAWKYTSRREKPTIRFSGREEEGEVFFCVEDNGAGFDPAHAAKLFQPFQRLHRQEEFPGIGIGLATAQRIIHRHGGMIRATGQQDRGATFCFSLPH